jgi:hypothetical protein
MGLHIFVYENPATRDIQVKSRSGGYLEKEFPSADPGFVPRFHEYNSLAIVGRLREEWMRTSKGLQALRIALDADSRGECRCDVLFEEIPWCLSPGHIN